MTPTLRRGREYTGDRVLKHVDGGLREGERDPRQQFVGRPKLHYRHDYPCHGAFHSVYLAHTDFVAILPTVTARDGANVRLQHGPVRYQRLDILAQLDGAEADAAGTHGPAEL